MGYREGSEDNDDAVGFTSCMSAMMDAVREKAVPLAAIYRLATASGKTTLGKMVDLAHADWLAEQQPQQQSMSLNHYRVRVNRGPLPPITTLEELYSEDGVSALYNGSCSWTKDHSRVGANDVTADKVVMVVKKFTAEEIRKMDGLTSENVIAWGFRNGLVAADEKETHAFGINHETCDLQLSLWLVGLGSSTRRGSNRFVAVLSSAHGRRILGFGRFDETWYAGHRFLFVRK